jgi:uncharacterized membrane protein YhiD involved in acid resistance
MDNRIFDWLKGMETTDLAPAYTLENLALTLLLGVFLGQVVAWVYMWTHSGVSYTRSFTQSLVLLTIVVSLVMFVIGNSIVTAFGLIGALAIIRFRNVLKDTRDTVYVFFSLVLGMALGSQRHLAALVGTIALLVVALYLHLTRFGSLASFDGHVSVRVSSEGEFPQPILKRHCRKTRQISARHRGEDEVDYVLEVRLRNRKRGAELVSELQEAIGISAASLVLRDELAEI